jgi:3',5'-cyclic AMP phosphodiesterase CpdA
MSKPLTIAQLTDVHLGPIRGFTPRYWNLKRLTGYINWQSKRRNAYRRDVLDRLVADLRQQAPDHIVVTGDLANIGLPQELIQGLDWLQSLGKPDAVSVIPGNHDIYGRLRRDPGTDRWAAYMSSNPAGAAWTDNSGGEPFPYVRLFGQVALVGVNSAIVTPPLIAWGEVGAAQRERLGRLLDKLGQAQLFRLVLIHHPPLPGQAKLARGLRDAAALEKVLTQHGAELVIHGHNHLNSLVWRHSASGPLPVIGAPSASLGRPYRHEPLARYNLYRIAGPPWRIELIGRGLAEPGSQVQELERRVLAPHEPAA